MLNALGEGVQSSSRLQLNARRFTFSYAFASSNFVQANTQECQPRTARWLFRAIHIVPDKPLWLAVQTFGRGTWQIISDLRSPLFASTPVRTSLAALWPSCKPILRQKIL